MSRFAYRGVLVSLLYVYMIDGVVRLETNSSNATLLRDVGPWLLAAAGFVYLATKPELIALPGRSVIALVALYVALGLIQIFNPDTITPFRGVAALRPHLEFVPLFFVGYAVMRSAGRLRWLAIVFALSAAANGLVSIVQSRLTPAQLGTWGPGYAYLVTSAHGSGQAHNAAEFVNANGVSQLRPPGLGAAVGFGGTLALIAVPMILALIVGTRGRRGRLLAALCLPLALAAAVTSQTRSAIIGSVVSAVVFVLLLSLRQSRRVAPALAMGAVGLTIVSVVGVSIGRYTSIAPSHLLSTFASQRGGSITLIPQYASAYPFGAGLGSAGPGVAAHASVNAFKLSGENSFTYLIIELGLPGLLCVTALLIAGLRRGVRLSLAPVPADARIYLCALTAGLTACVVETLSGGVTAAPPLSPFIWLSLGILTAWTAHAARPIVRILPRT